MCTFRYHAIIDLLQRVCPLARRRVFCVHEMHFEPYLSQVGGGLACTSQSSSRLELNKTSSAVEFLNTKHLASFDIRKAPTAGLFDQML